MQKHQLKRAAVASTITNGSSRPMRRVVTEAYMRFVAPSVSTQDVRRRAYYIWELAGKPPGDGVKFWLEAERELMQPY